MKIQSLIFPIIFLFISCNVHTHNKHDNTTSKNQSVMNELEQKIYDAIKACGELCVSADTLSEKLNIPIKDLEIMLKSLYEKELLNKTKAHVYEKIKGEGTVIKGTLLYTVRK